MSLGSYLFVGIRLATFCWNGTSLEAADEEMIWLKLSLAVISALTALLVTCGGINL